MATKAKKAKVSEDFTSSYGVNASVPDPVDLGGDTHAGRGADQATGDDDQHPALAAGGSEQPTHADVVSPELSKAELIAGLLSTAYAMEKPELAAMYDSLRSAGGIGQNPHAGRAADQSTPDVRAESYREDVVAVLGEGLDEEQITRATNLFNAAVDNKVISLMAEREEEYQTALDKAIEENVAELEETNAKYMDYVAAKWLEENQPEVKSAIRVELAESFLAGLHDLFEDHYINIPEDKVDVVEALADQVETLKEQLASAESKLIEQQVDTEQSEVEAIREAAIEEASAGLTVSQKERLAMLAESVEFDTLEDLTESLKSIVDVVLPATKSGSALSTLEEEAPALGGETIDEDADPTIAAIAKFASTMHSAK